MAELKKIVRLDRSAGIPVGLGAGVLCGLFFGEWCAWLGIVGRAYIGLLQMAVLPYMVVSLIGGIGDLDAAKARRLAATAGVVLLASWLLALCFVYLTPLAFPPKQAGTFFSPSLTESRSFDFVDLYVPANPFRSMAETIVPAVAVFSVATGIALISVERESKRSLLEVLDVLSTTLTKVSAMVIRFAPYGLFAIAASTAGTMSIEEFGQLQVYMGTFVLMSLVLTFVALPGIVAALTPFRYGEVLGAAKSALLTGFATGNLFVVMPLLVEEAKTLFQKRDLRTGDTDNFIEVLVPISFNFPMLAKLLKLSFVLFAGWYTGATVEVSEYPAFSFMGVFSLFGGVKLALPFMLDQLRIPSDMFQLYLVTGAVIGWFAALLAAMNLFAFTLIATSAATGALKLNARRGVAALAAVVGVLVVAIPAARLTYARFLGDMDHAQATLTQMRIEDAVESRVLTARPGPRDAAEPVPSRLSRVLESGVIRVGYHGDKAPFAYFNASGELVGYDVALMHTLAHELGVALEFIPWTYETRDQQLQSGEIDVAIGGLFVNARRLANGSFTGPYMTVTAAVVVEDYRRDEFDSWEEIGAAEDLHLAILGQRVAESVRVELPSARVSVVESPRNFFEASGSSFDGIIMSAEAGYAHTILYPRFDVAIPLPHTHGELGLATPKGDAEWTGFLSDWIRLKRDDETTQELYDKWILGNGNGEAPPRWSILRDVLHWVD